jgi:Family of unknown function (DUF6459)
VTATTALVTEPTAPAAGRITVLPAPSSEPPYDDEIPHRTDVTSGRHDCGERQGALALAFVLPGGLPAVPTVAATPRLHVVRTSAGDDEDDGADFARRPTERSSLPPPQQFAGRLVQALVEVTAGARPRTQLIRWTSERVYAEINRRVRELASAGAPGKRGLIAGHVRSLHVSEPRDGVAEVCAVVQRGPRAGAVAIRLEGLDGRWVCTAATFG